MAVWTGVSGKRVVITGATRGIGLAAACELARRGAQVTVVARSEERGEAAAERIADTSGGDSPDVLLADLASQRSVRRLAAEILDRYPRLDVLINNAGAINSSRRMTDDGIELTWAVNHLAPFLLTGMLLDRLRESAPSRVITTASEAHRGAHLPFDDLDGRRSWHLMGFGRYGETKLANIVFSRELARRLRGSGVSVNAFHPGFVDSGFNHNNGLLMSAVMTLTRPFARSPEKGAETLVWLADEAPQTDTGGYWSDLRKITPSPAARDARAARTLWEISELQTAEMPRRRPSGRRRAAAR